jgi:hypothetical protein
MRAQSEAQLHFLYGVPGATVLATARHAALDAARREEVPFELRATSRGAISIAGARRRVAQVRAGRLVEPVRFHLRAGDADRATGAEEDNESGVHIEFVVRGETVHQMMLAIQVRAADGKGVDAGVPYTPEIAAGRLTAALLADATEASPPAEHRVKLSLSVDGSDLHVELDHYVGGNDEWSDVADAPKLDAAALAALATSLRGELTKVYEGGFWERFDGKQPTAPGGGSHPALARALECVAAAGSRLNDGLRADPGLARLLDYIETKVPNGALLTISTDSVFLPWELLTPQEWSLAMTPKQKAANPAPNPNLFWGVRFAIETNPKSVPVGERRRSISTGRSRWLRSPRRTSPLKCKESGPPFCRSKDFSTRRSTTSACPSGR